MSLRIVSGNLIRTSVRRSMVRRVAAVQFVRPLSCTVERKVEEKSEQSTPPPPPPPPPPSSSGNFTTILLLAAAGAAGYYGYTKYYAGSTTAASAAAAGITAATATFDDYKKVYNAIAKKLIDDDEYDDGSYGPVLVRLAWHSSGTFDKTKNDGGSGSGTMRFPKEVGYAANAGLENGKKFLESIHKEFPWLTHGDLYTLGGVVAVQEMGGPSIPWRAGRIDQDETFVTADGRLPDASQGSSHIRDIFYRMGFNDQEIVALIGAHALGRCHTQNSGYDGPWTFSPTVFTNDFFKLLLDEKWHIRKWNGPKQYEDDSTKSLMMLPADFAIIQDKEFKKWAQKYAADNDLFFRDFASAFSRLLELGVKFGPERQPWVFPVYSQ